ncbi:MAG: type VI secretion system contractile sheath large subunit, partial [Gemmatimonadota bacterium]|nr:type VI secretion system contractile sheath large subunit [Gemmatimonadota bacterium]
DRSDRAVDPSGGSLLTDVLEATTGRSDHVDAPDGIDPEVRRLAREAVRRHAVDAVADRSREIAELDGRAGDLMRRILHEPRVRGLESLWRSVSFLLSRSDSTGKVRVYLGDVSTDDLERDAGQGLERSRLARLLMNPEPSPPGGRWAVLVGAQRVDDPGGFGWLAHVGRAARAADVPWIGAAGLELAGVSRDTGEPLAQQVGEEAVSAWTSIRGESWAPWVTLACPSFLARAPYGPDSERSTRAFDFRELELPGGGEGRPNAPWRGRLQWANPAFACAASLGAAFARGGWTLDPASEPDHLGVPIAPVPDGEPVVVETTLSPEGARAAIRAGLVPLLAFPREARVRVGGFRSIALAQGAPAGWWR